MYISALCVSVYARVTKVDRERKKSAKNKEREKMRGHRAKTGSQPNQFGLAKSGCTISHQSTFSMLSDLPSIHRGHPLCTLLRNKTEKEKERQRKRKKIHIHMCRGYWTLILLRHRLCFNTNKYQNIPCHTKFRYLRSTHQCQWANKHAAYQDLIMLVIGCIMLYVVRAVKAKNALLSFFFFTASCLWAKITEWILCCWLASQCS